MKIILLSLLITNCAAQICNEVYFKRKYYNITIIKEGINNIHELIFNRNDNTAYFTFDQISEVPTRTLGYIKLDTKETGVIDGIRNATGLAIDQSLNRLYVGGSDGLFFINTNRKQKVPEKMPVMDDIRNVFVKNGIVYYINRYREANKFEFGHSNPVYELQGVATDKLILDDDNNIFFLQNVNLFRVKLGTRIVNSHEKYVVNDLTVNPNFKPYISAIDGIYEYNKYKYVLDKVSDINNLKRIAFVNADEIIYVVKDKLIRLQYNPIPCTREVY